MRKNGARPTSSPLSRIATSHRRPVLHCARTQPTADGEEGGRSSVALEELLRFAEQRLELICAPRPAADRPGPRRGAGRLLEPPGGARHRLGGISGRANGGKAIRQAHEQQLRRSLVEQAIDDAAREGWLRRREADRLRAELLALARRPRRMTLQSPQARAV
jgi:hypothetical protein